MEEKFSIVKRGYDPSEVDKYIEGIEAALVSYKEKDASIKNAIVSAQIAADSIVNKAEFEANHILKNADDKAADKIAEVDRFIKNTMDAVEVYKRQITSFRTDYNAMIAKYTAQFDENEFEKLISDADEIKGYLSHTMSSLPETEENPPEM